MDRKNIPLLLMLSAGAITCILTYVMHFNVLAKLVALFLVLVVFFVLGSALVWALDYFDKQNAETRRLAEEAAAAAAEEAAKESTEESVTEK